MSKTWLLVDSNNIAYRAFYSVGRLSFDDIQTGVVFGFLKSIISLKEIHQTENIAFCFDSKESIRSRIHPAYKQKRKEQREALDEDEQEKRQEFIKQVELLRREYLKSVGFSNIFHEEGYEADDLIAKLVRDMDKRDKAVIVSSDHDMYQLLSPTVQIWNMHKGQRYTLQSFRQEFGIEPEQWVDVKAMAGCSSDNIEGLPQIGEKTACKYLRGKLNKDTAAYKTIKNGGSVILKNKQLVTLPMTNISFPVAKGTSLSSESYKLHDMTLRDDSITLSKWLGLCERLGMTSLQNTLPVSNRSTVVKRKTKHGE